MNLYDDIVKIAWQLKQEQRGICIDLSLFNTDYILKLVYDDIVLT